ncbi:flagellar biosynthesis protein FlhB [Alsobacter metallidurans]|uniref:Flagellar biosynthetic protein FlhB n=1 Tax=Alsobacter metallidurans TaxID=340221 RepID=A0A917I936_9HYPH|nr:flagellar biosynthesis protein FlhB [Alsobacter metallidurans]GGH26389.1 flagellar biosynthesis protein FlhB [Alsobacter metallidurans]
MAGEDDQEDRTEEPSLRRLEQAIEKGDIAKSQEVNTWFVLAGGTLALVAVADSSASSLKVMLGGLLAQAGRVSAEPGAVKVYGEYGLWAGLSALAFPLGILMLAGLAGGMVQHKPSLSTQPLAPQLSRISPLSGFKRVFGKEALVQFLKGLLKLGVVGVAIYMAVWPEMARLESFATMDVAMLLQATKAEAVTLMKAVLIIYAAIAGGDYVYQRFTWYNRQRMTKQEVKDEHKETDGNPEIKAKIRQLRAKQARQRMMSKVPTATVVVMNPTHFAVALQYEPGMAAPQCVAKGLDAVALRIRAMAEENDVPVVENPPLARALYKAVELDQDIPVEHYKAVAEVIGYVMRLRRRRY